MVNLNVPFPDDLRSEAEAAARRQGIPLDEFVRNCVSNAVHPAQDPLFADQAIFTGKSPADLAENHDEYLYGKGT
jgi:hypothetical protein